MVKEAAPGSNTKENTSAPIEKEMKVKFLGTPEEVEHLKHLVKEKKIPKKVQELLLAQEGNEFTPGAIALTILRSIKTYLHEGRQTIISTEGFKIISYFCIHMNKLVKDPQASSKVLEEMNKALPDLATMFPYK